MKSRTVKTATTGKLSYDARRQAALRALYDAQEKARKEAEKAAKAALLAAEANATVTVA